MRLVWVPPYYSMWVAHACTANLSVVSTCLTWWYRREVSAALEIPHTSYLLVGANKNYCPVD